MFQASPAWIHRVSYGTRSASRCTTAEGPPPKAVPPQHRAGRDTPVEYPGPIGASIRTWPHYSWPSEDVTVLRARRGERSFRGRVDLRAARSTCGSRRRSSGPSGSRRPPRPCVFMRPLLAVVWMVVGVDVRRCRLLVRLVGSGCWWLRDCRREEFAVIKGKVFDVELLAVVHGEDLLDVSTSPLRRAIIMRGSMTGGASASSSSSTRTGNRTQITAARTRSCLAGSTSCWRLMLRATARSIAHADATLMISRGLLGRWRIVGQEVGYQQLGVDAKV